MNGKLWSAPGHISLMTDKVQSVSSWKVFPLTKVAALLTQLGATPVLRVFVAWACTLKLPLHQVEDWKRQNCQNVPPAGTQCRQMGANCCGSSKPSLISLCRRHLRRCKTSIDLLPLRSCFIVLRHVTNNIYHSACWQVMTQETSAHSFLENRDYYQIFLLTR